MGTMTDFTVLGCCGSYSGPGACCSGYLLRGGGAAIWVDCGNGTLAALQRHISLEELTAVFVSHIHPDHCVDVFGLDVAFRYGGLRQGLEIFAPNDVRASLQGLAGESFGSAFEWVELEGSAPRALHRDLDLQFSLTDHPVPTYAMCARTDSTSLAYTSDTGPGWSGAELGDDIDLWVSEATYLNDFKGAPIHLAPSEAANLATARNAKRLLLTHFWPGVDPAFSVAEASAEFPGVIPAHEGLHLQI